MTQAEATKVPEVRRASVPESKRGKIDRFNVDLLERLASRVS
jgi:predicted XRE-type DNA-binding protein